MRRQFLGEAAALLFPVDWPEPFGLVMIEAMACGTPVLAFRGGSIPEIIDDGVTGDVVDSEEDAIAALPAILSYDRREVRQRFEESHRHKNGPRLCQYLSPVDEDTHVWRQAASTRHQWWQWLGSQAIKVRLWPVETDPNVEIPPEHRRITSA